MEQILTFFPLNAKVQKSEERSLATVILIYIALAAAASILHWLLGWVVVVGTLLSILSWLVGVYSSVGIILAIIQYVK